LKKIDVDRVVAGSIWSHDQGIKVSQRYNDYFGTVQDPLTAKVGVMTVGGFPKYKVYLRSFLEP
jgi:hypothetical protein